MLLNWLFSLFLFFISHLCQHNFAYSISSKNDTIPLPTLLIEWQYPLVTKQSFGSKPIPKPSLNCYFIQIFKWFFQRTKSQSSRKWRLHILPFGPDRNGANCQRTTRVSHFPATHSSSYKNAKPNNAHIFDAPIAQKQWKFVLSEHYIYT